MSNLICAGTGLVALDVVISSDLRKPAQFLAGGSCGNVMTILSFLGWQSFPIARLSNNGATELLMQDLSQWSIHDDLLSFSDDGSTPIIIHRILKDKQGILKHRFEFRNPEDGMYLPSYKPCLSKAVQNIISISPTPQVFYFDRINSASIELAKEYKTRGSIIFFEPSSLKDEKGFKKCMEIADIVKFSEERISDFENYYPKAQAKIEIRTLGKRGLEYRSNQTADWIYVKGYSIDNVIDTAGAGDWCSAGIISSLFSDTDFDFAKIHNKLSKAIKFGQALSALNCTFEGARGLMYNINKRQLLSKVDEILSSKSRVIVQPKPLGNAPKTSGNHVKISSLFVRG